MDAARSALEKLGDRGNHGTSKTSAGAVAEETLEALGRAGDGSPSEKSSPEAAAKRIEAAQRAAAEASRALQAGLQDLSTLKQALSASQSAASEESSRLARAVEALPPGPEDDGSRDAASKDAGA